MNLSKYVLTVLFIVPTLHAATYKEELMALATSPSHRMVFDEDAHAGLKDIARDIEAYPKLSQFQRFALSALELVLVTPTNMPTLYAYIDGVCSANDLKTPPVFIATNQGFFNALALKIFGGTGVVVIGKKIIMEASNDEIDGVLAHELGHIKYNHGTKKFCIFMGAYIGTSIAAHKFTTNQYARAYLPYLIAPIATGLIINKHYEKEADEFAYKVVGKGPGLAKFFNHLEEKEEAVEHDFDATYQMLENNKKNLAFGDNALLWARYYLVKGGHKLHNAVAWLYHNTFLGDHPSPQARIEAIRSHLAQPC